MEEILMEIKEMRYPPGDGATCTGIDIAACCGFDAAKEQVRAIIRSHMGDGGWTPCEDGLPDEPVGGMRDLDSLDEYIVMVKDADIPTSLRYAGKGEWYDAVTEDFYPVIAWRPYPAPYRPKHKAVGEDFKGKIMERFLKVE